jgi:protein-tyrosine phosphatase
MIDWHSHVLPKMDDGSKSVEESLSMLDVMSAQGVTTVIATPHFYANEDSVDSFLRRRKASYEMLSQRLNLSHPKLHCGAEVAYYPGISKLESLKSLAIENTNVLLLEMPFSKWTEYTVKELIELSGTSGLRIVLAHIDRYIDLQGINVFSELCYNGIYMQVNSIYFKGFFNKRKALNLLDAGLIHFIGSDCHNMTSRPPNLILAYDLIRRKFGSEYVIQMNEFGNKILEHF